MVGEPGILSCNARLLSSGTRNLCHRHGELDYWSPRRGKSQGEAFHSRLRRLKLGNCSFRLSFKDAGNSFRNYRRLSSLKSYWNIRFLVSASALMRSF